MSILQWMWGLLPDTCEVDDCCREGVRGNENRVYPFKEVPDFYIVMCDYCHSEYLEGIALKVTGLKDMIIVRGSPIVELSQYKKRKKFEQPNCS